SLALLGQLFQPAPARGGRRIEAAALREHAVVGDVAEERREQVHLPQPGKRVLRELREVQHRDLAVLLLHFTERAGRCAAAPAGPALEEAANRIRAGRDALEL